MSTAYIVYLIVYRLAIISAGFGCVIMGYRLFVMGVMPKDGSSIDANAGEIRLSLKNAAPGTCFAALGVLLIASMVLQGNPEKKEETVTTSDGTHQTSSWRDDNPDIPEILARGKELEQSGQFAEAILTYAKPLENGDLLLKNAIDPIRAIAGVYLKQKHLQEAMAYALLAYQVAPQNAEGLALIARIHNSLGNHDDAISYMAKAAKIDAAYGQELERMASQNP